MTISVTNISRSSIEAGGFLIPQGRTNPNIPDSAINEVKSLQAQGFVSYVWNPDTPAAAMTASEVAKTQALVSGYGIPMLRRVLRDDSDVPASVPGYAGSCTVTAGQTSSSIVGGVLFPTSTGSAFNAAVYEHPSLAPTPRVGATSFIEARSHHTGTDMGAAPAIARMHWRMFTDAPVFEVQMYGVGNSDYAILVDGALVSSQAAKANNGSTYYDKYDFSAESVPRKRRLVEIFGNGSFYFAGLRVAGTDCVWRAPALPRVIFLGDSFTAGSGTGYMDWSSTAARRLGWMEFKSGVGSTGYLSTNGGASVKFRTRLAVDVSAHSPDAIVVAGGINDIPGYGSNNWTNADLQTEAALLYAEVLAANPMAPVIVVGPWRGSSGNAGSYSTPEMDASLQAAASSLPEYGNRLIYLPTLLDPAGPWQFGNTTSGNFSIYGSVDGTHPLQPGYEYLGNRFADAVRRVLLRSTP